MISPQELPDNLRPSLNILGGAAPGFGANPSMATALQRAYQQAGLNVPAAQPQSQSVTVTTPSPPEPSMPMQTNPGQSLTPPQPSSPAAAGRQIWRKMDDYPLNGQPGSFARSVLASAQQVLSGFGDVSTKPTEQTSPAGGFLEGLAETMANRNTRVEKQKQQEFENQRALATEQRESAESSARISMNNMQVRNMESEIHQRGETARLSNIERDKALKVMFDAEHAVPEFHGTAEQALAKGLDFGKAMKVAVGSEDSGQKNKDGSPALTTVYDIYEHDQPVKLTKSLTNMFNDYQATQSGKEGAKPFTEGQSLPFDQMHTMYTQARALQEADATAAEFVKKTLGDKAVADIQKTAADPDFIAAFHEYMSRAGNEGQENPDHVLAQMLSDVTPGVNPKTGAPIPPKRPDLAAKFGKAPLTEAFQDRYGGAVMYKDAIDNREKLRERELEERAIKDRLAENDIDSPKQQTLMAKDYGAKVAANTRTRAGDINPLDQTIIGANKVAGVARQMLDPKTGRYNLNPGQWNELVVGLARLISPAQMADVHTIEQLRQRSLTTDLGQIKQYLTSNPAAGQSQSLIKLALASIDREAQIATKTRAGIFEEIKHAERPPFLQQKHVDEIEKAFEHYPTYTPLLDESGHPIDDTGKGSAAAPQTPAGHWTDPNTGKTYLVDKNGMAFQEVVSQQAQPQAQQPQAPQAQAAPPSRPQGAVGTWTAGNGAVYWINQNGEQVGIKTPAPVKTLSPSATDSRWQQAY